MNLTALLLLLAGAAVAQTVPTLLESRYCPNYPSGRPPLGAKAVTSGDMRKIVINSPGAVCNDGSPAVMYVRAARAGATEPDGPSSNRWIIHLEGGGYCNTFEDCGVRWCGLGFYSAAQMSSTPLPDFINKDGLFGRNSINRLGDRNLVMVNYCSSDAWQGRKSDAVLRSVDDSTKAYSLHFQGATIANAAIDALEKGVTGMPKLTDAADVLFSGDSAGAGGVRQHLDRFAARLKASNPTVRVRGQLEATFSPDFNGKQGFPAGDPRDPVYTRKTDNFNRVQIGLLNAQLDDSCLAAHSTSQYLCSDSGYLELNHLTTPFFQIQDISDPNLLEDLQEGGLTATPAEFSQTLFDQLTLLGNIRSTAVDKASITVNPGAVGRNCGIHVTWSNDDGFLGRRIRSGPGATAYSYYELLWNWMTGATPVNVLSPRPPSTPDVPATDPICDAKAPTAPPPPTIASASNASYNYDGPVAPESIVITFGTNLSTTTATASPTSWPTTLGGLQVTVTDARGVARLAPLYYVSATQVLFLVPTGTASGTAQVAIGSQRTTLQVATTAPGIYSANANGKGVAAAAYIRITSRGVRTDGLIFDAVTRQDTGVPAAQGDQIYLILYGTGLRGGTASATIGGVSVPIAGPVAQGQYPGLDQINLGPLPLSIGLGQKQIVIREDSDLANTVTVTFRTP